MAATFDVASADGLKSLDEYLLTRSYITGCEASHDDLTLYMAFGSAPSKDLVNVSRWNSHISALIKAVFPGKAAGITVKGTTAAAPAAASASAPVEEEEDDVDLFGEETEEEKAAAAERETSKASAKKKESGKSSIVMDVKPWDDETDMAKLEKFVRDINMDGLHWGASKLVPVGYGIKKLQIMFTVEDDKVSPNDLIEDHLEETEFIQSCDIVVFNKI